MSSAGPEPRPDFAALELGRDRRVQELDSLAACRLVTLSLAAQFTRSLDIVTRDLDNRLYDDARFIAHVRSTLVANRRARLRVLVRDPGPAIRAGHRLLDLAVRLSSFVELRVPARAHAEFNQAMLIADGVGLLRRPLADRYEAEACFSSRALAGELLRTFNEMWAVARLDSGLRRLHI